MILLSDCSCGTYKVDRCKINGDVAYLNTTSLSELNLPEDLRIGITSSKLYDDYVIPFISADNISTQKIGKQLNICPPLVWPVDEMLHESCIIKNED